MSIKSLCIDICRFDSRAGLCIDCPRTHGECKGWKKMKDRHRRKVIEDRSYCESRLNK
ncbi:DUF1289 domain-containing protein [Paraburkholderia sp. GAS448]|uniref:DUF1289 domain-containing protein n=1 Tax=Paraburkholderia sp. GAS448 TaxID=3035136 RepID=UPI003D1A0C33